MIDTKNKAGDIIFKAGDGGVNGDGGNLTIGPGTYKAGDYIQKKEKGVLRELAEVVLKIFK